MRAARVASGRPPITSAVWRAAAKLPDAVLFDAFNRCQCCESVVLAASAAPADLRARLLQQAIAAKQQKLDVDWSDLVLLSTMPELTAVFARELRVLKVIHLYTCARHFAPENAAATSCFAHLPAHCCPWPPACSNAAGPQGL